MDPTSCPQKFVHDATTYLVNYGIYICCLQDIVHKENETGFYLKMGAPPGGFRGDTVCGNSPEEDNTALQALQAGGCIQQWIHIEESMDVAEKCLGMTNNAKHMLDKHVKELLCHTIKTCYSYYEWRQLAHPPTQ